LFSRVGLEGNRCHTVYGLNGVEILPTKICLAYGYFTKVLSCQEVWHILLVYIYHYVMSCNVEQYLPIDDSPVEEVELIVHLKMTAQQGRRRSRGRGHFLPPQNVEFVITTKEGHTLHLTGFCLTDLDECHLALQQSKLVLRKFHAHDGHINPMRRNHSISRIHMHFPSTKFSLIEGRSSYAYSIDEDGFNDVADCLEFFCAELNIDMTGWQPYLRPY